MLRNYLKITIRNLGRKKTYSIINVFGLSIGIASSILILLWVHDEMSYDRFHEKGERIYRIIINNQGVRSAATCGALAPTLKREIPEIVDAVRLWSPSPWQLYYGEKNIQQLGNYVDPSFFNVFSFPLLQGDAKTALLDHHSVVITESVAAKLFEDNDALGKTIHIRNRWGKKEPFVVTGVMRDIPRHSHIQFDFLFSFNLLKEWYRPDFAEQWRNYSFQAYVLLQGNSEISIVDHKISACYQKNTGNQYELFLQPLYDVYLNADINNHSGGDYEYLRLFIGIAFFILLIACINYMNLATARSAPRSKEIALRKVLGANRQEIVLYQFFESLFFTFLALTAALLIIELVQSVFNSITGVVVEINYRDPTFLTAVLAIVLITGLLSGYYPAVYLSSCNPVKALKGMHRSGKSFSSFRMILVVFQFAVANIIIIATLVTSGQMSFIKSKDLGFEKENLIYTWTSGFNTDTIREELLKNPNIINVAGSGAQLDWIGWWQGIDKWDGHMGDRSVRFGVLEVGYTFLDTYGIELADGRFYSRNFSSDEEQAIVINENAVKAMQMESPVGKTLYFNGANRRIVGVVKDFHFESLHSSITPLLFVLYPKQLRCLGIRAKQENIATTLQHIKKVIASFEPDYVLEYKFLDEQLNRLYLKEQKRYTLFRVFSFISIVLSCLGLFGLILYTAEQRTKEIGVRKVLGASVPGIVSMISKDFLKWVLMANVLAWPIAWWVMNKWLQDFAYRIDIGWWVFALAGGMALLIALLTVSTQAIKAALANPVEALRYE